MAKVDPFVIPLPTELARSPTLGPYFQYLQRFLHDLWQRTGAGTDLVDAAVTTTDLTAAIAAHTSSANNATDAEVAFAVANEAAARNTAISTAITTHEADSDPHPGYLTETEADALYDVLGAAVGVLPDIADDFANDAAAATGGISVGRLYHAAGVVKLRLS